MLASDPDCSITAVQGVTKIGDEVNMTCRVTFNGSIWQRPQMSWFINSELILNASQVANPNVAVWTDYRLVALQQQIPSYTMKAYFEVPLPSWDQPPNLSKRIPNYYFVWRSPIIDVVPSEFRADSPTVTSTASRQ